MTNIPYADETWPVVTGCSKVSQGCRRCWAEVLDRRFNKAHKPWTPENAAENVVLHPEKLDKPLHWRRPRTVAVCFMSDLFHPMVPDSFVGEMFEIMAATPQHRYLILTKRPERINRVLGPKGCGFYMAEGPVPCPQPNVWLGVSAENQHWADVRIPLLLDTPAAHRWVSLEPLLGPIDLGQVLETTLAEKLHWVVIGGESGPRHRPMELAWADRISEQCRAGGVDFYGKQIAATRPDQPLPGELGRRETPWNAT